MRLLTERAVLLMMLGALSGCLALGELRDGPRVLALTINAPEDAEWTSTTWEAVSTPAHRKVLEKAKAKTIIGEVVDVSCYLQLGKRGEAHIPCGQQCVRHGQPVGILTDDEELYLVFAEEHHPRRDGTVSLRERFVELMGKRVQVSGMVTKHNDRRTLFLRTLPKERP